MTSQVGELAVVFGVLGGITGTVVLYVRWFQARRALALGALQAWAQRNGYVLLKATLDPVMLNGSFATFCYNARLGLPDGTVREAWVIAGGMLGKRPTPEDLVVDWRE